MTTEQIAIIRVKCFDLANEMWKCDNTRRSIEQIADDIYKWVANQKDSFQLQVDKNASDLINKKINSTA